MIQAKLADGRTLEFPDGTEDAIINAAVKKSMGIEGVGIPEGGGPPISALTPSTTEPPTLRIGPGQPPAGPTEPTKPLGERIVEEIPQVGGGIVGGIAAGTAGMGIIPIVGAVAFGAGTGEAYKQIGQHLSGSLDAPRTSIDAAKRIGKAGLTEAGWELVGGLVAKGFGKIIAPLKKKMVEGSEEAINLFKDKLKPVVLLPAEATESRVLDLLQNVSESSIVGGSSIQNYKTQRIKFFDDFADSLITEFGKHTDTTDLGNLFVTSISNSRAVHSKAAKILYNSVKAGKAKTEIGSLKNFAKPLQRRATKLEGIEAKNAGDDLVDAVMDLPDRLSYKEATELRSRLISRIDEFSILNKKAPAIGKAKKLVGLLDSAIEKSLKGIGEPVTKTVGRVGLGPIPKGKIRIYHGRNVKLSSTSKQAESGIHFSIDEDRAAAFATHEGPPVGDIAGGDVSGTVHALDIDPQKMLELPEMVPGESLETNWSLEGIKLKLLEKVKDGKLKAATKSINNIKNDGDLFKFLDKKGFDGISYMELQETQSYIIPKSKAVESPNVDVNQYYLYGEGDEKTIGELFEKVGVPTLAPKVGKKRAIIPTGPTPYEAWRTANRFYKDGQKKFNNVLLRRLVKLADDTGTGAEMIAPAIFKPRHISSVRKVKLALKDDPKTWRKLQGFFMHHILQKSVDTDGNVIGKKILNNISGKPNSFGIPMMKEVFSEAQIKTLRTFGEAVKLTQGRQAEGAGRVLIQLTQAGALGAILTGNLALPAATIIIAPAIMSKMMLNPRMAKLLTTGLTLPAKSPEAMGIMTRLTAAAIRINQGDEDETTE